MLVSNGDDDYFFATNCVKQFVRKARQQIFAYFFLVDTEMLRGIVPVVWPRREFQLQILRPSPCVVGCSSDKRHQFHHE